MHRLEMSPLINAEELDSANTSIQLSESIATTVNQRSGVYEDLYAVVRAGKEAFGVVKLSVINHEKQETTERYVLTRFGKEGERGQAGMFIDDDDTMTLVGKNRAGALQLDDTISDRHFAINVEDGVLRVNSLDPEKPIMVMTAVEGSDLARSAHAGPLEGSMAWSVQSSEVKEMLAEVEGRQELEKSDQLKYEAVDHDPAFMAIVQPHQEKITLLHKQLEQVLSETDPNDHDRIAAIRGSWEGAAAKARAEYEAAVKPYFLARLELFRDDRGPGYSIPGKVHYDSKTYSVISDSGRKLVHYSGHSFIQSGSITTGQVSLPDRFSSWAGSSRQKTNHKTAKTVTSTEHIADLASAIVAGTMGPEHEPIVIKRDEIAEYNLPKEIQGKLRLYKVTLGMHRVAAQRLIGGLDSSLGYTELQQ